MGKNTLYIYLFHMFLVLPLIKLSGDYSAGKTELIILTGSVVISLLLANKMVANVLKRVIYPEIPERIKSKIQL